MAEWSKALYPASGGASCSQEQPDMAFVYIIQDKISGRYYIGSCLDLDKRVKRHSRHTGGNTTKHGEWELVYYRELPDILDARLLEKKVKSYKGGNAFKKIVHGDVAEWSKAPHC